jgi:hypothetical protein
MVTGLVHGSSEPGIVDLLDRFQGELLHYGRGAAAIAGAPLLDPGHALGHALAAAVQLFTMAPAGLARARPLVAEAERLAPAALPRERMLVQAIAAWSVGRIDRALALHFEIARRWPRDLVSARIAQFHQLNRGDFAGMRALTSLLLEANQDVPAVQGMHAFALEQTGEPAAAEGLGRAAADAGFDPWAEHAVAHVLERAGRSAEGVAFLAPRSDGWSRCSSFLRTHNWWHLALFHLDLGDTAAVLALYDGEVWGVRKDYCQDQVNAVSLLARLELHGADVGGRWAELAGWLMPRTGEHVNGFLDLHYLYGLARAGETQAVAAMLESLCAQAAARQVTGWTAVAEAAAGLAAHAAGHWAEAAARLGPVLPRLAAAGGSSTQQDLFRLVHLDALVRSAPGEARALLAARVALRGEHGWASHVERRLAVAA